MFPMSNSEVTFSSGIVAEVETVKVAVSVAPDTSIVSDVVVPLTSKDLVIILSLFMSELEVKSFRVFYSISIPRTYT